MFLARFDKQDEDKQVLDETEFLIRININHKVTESDLDNIDIKSSLEHQIQQKEMKVSGWRINKVNSMTKFFYNICEHIGRSFVKIPLRSSAILNIENYD